ncbi:poly polymerase 2 [Diplogelasinospora grovesii]|uniref:Poly [ADP-ribose] polymerase n=1 Tax=Diplogelasinospora grovesii TaxID=303347 RepID=A0AAN6N446_9PEZI|nr:poly polymerase 2 [Diplogelasinospora grovesii]
MPPKRGKKAAPATPPLDGCCVAVSGTFPGLTQSALLARAATLGATSSISVTKETTHLVTTQADYDKPSAKVKTAQSIGTHIVSLEWFLNTESANAREPEQNYLLGAQNSASPTAPPQAPSSAAAAQGADDGAPKANGLRKSSRKRAATPVVDTAASDDAALPTRKGAAKKAAKSTDTASIAKDDDEEAKDEEPKAKKQKPEPVMGEGQVVKTRDIAIPLDEGCPFANAVVYIDPDGVVFDASLNQTNASNNNNKFYRIQLLHDPNGTYRTWTRWGRVGEHGQTAVLGGGSLQDAMRNFEKKFKDKSGLAWSQRGDNPKPGKYAFVERSYAVESDDEEEDADDKQKADAWQPPKSTLQPAVQNLMQLIFNQGIFARTMAELNYDANKLPLGKLSRATITRGFQALKDLSALHDDHSLAANYDATYGNAVELLSNLYYSLIPHDFGRNRPPVITDEFALKKELDLMESLSDMKDAALIMKLDKAAQDGIHPLDRQYQGLKLEEMTPLDPTTAEYTHLQQYLTQTRASTHRADYRVEAIFRIERQGESDRFHNSPFAQVAQDRRLLWHGSRSTNYGGILSQGLRIAPPEAPVSGYMFGKGIYLADMSSKSANYCCSYMSDDTALLLLCEAELGDPMQKLVHASYNAGEDAKAKGMLSTMGQGSVGPKKWKDASCVHPSLAGVQMPDTSLCPGETGVENASLLYNEYICYDVAQVRLRYLFRVKM